MIIPISTDAPIYHFPRATLALIAANFVAFFHTGGGYESQRELWMPWMLEYGKGLHPLEWVTVNFLHFGWMHLLSNMVFLWAFGLVVEGKLGWKRFLLVYFGIGISRAFVEQILMLGYVGDGGSGGASGIIYGLLAMAMVWAPRNDFTCLFFFFWIPRVFRMSILMFSIFYLGLQILMTSFFMMGRDGFTMTSEVIHLLGAVIGFAVATVMLKKGLVDCENWDLFAYLKGTHGSSSSSNEFRQRQIERRLHVTFAAEDDDSAREIDALEGDTAAYKRSRRMRKSLRQIRKFLSENKPNAALSQYQETRRLIPELQLDEEELRDLAEGLYKARYHSESIPIMEEYLERFPDVSPLIRVRLAGALVEIQRRPRYALRVLSQVPLEELSEKIQSHCRRIEQVATQLIEEGVIELDGQSWSQ